MKIRVDGTRCQAYGLCNEYAPSLFELDDWGYASVAGAAVSGEDEAAAHKAIEECPARAISQE